MVTESLVDRWSMRICSGSGRYGARRGTQDRQMDATKIR